VMILSWILGAKRVASVLQNTRKETLGRRPCAQRGGSGAPAGPPRSQTHTSLVLRNAIGELLQLEGMPLTW
jgi:hypothetical protein